MWNCFSRIFRNSSICINWLRKNYILLIIFIPIYLVNRLLKQYINYPIIGYLCKCHLNDFIGGILFCVYLNLVLVLNKKQPIKKFKHLFIFMIFISIAWEYFFPLFLDYSTSDFYDIIAYMSGTIFYYFFTYKTLKT